MCSRVLATSAHSCRLVEESIHASQSQPQVNIRKASWYPVLFQQARKLEPRSTTGKIQQIEQMYKTIDKCL